jgi:protein tyrosine phosphatase
MGRTYIPHPKHIPFEYSKITDNIYLGSNQCCVTHFKKSLLKKGIKADISLDDVTLDSPFGVKYFLWLPVVDRKAPSQDQLGVGAWTIKSLVDKKQKMYVHCKRGHGRSPTLVAAYFILEGMTAAAAIKKIRSKRAIHVTQPQLKALRIFEKKVKR